MVNVFGSQTSVWEFSSYTSTRQRLIRFLISNHVHPGTYILLYIEIWPWLEYIVNKYCMLFVVQLDEEGIAPENSFQGFRGILDVSNEIPRVASR